jgi:hypothetical protein
VRGEYGAIAQIYRVLTEEGDRYVLVTRKLGHNPEYAIYDGLGAAQVEGVRRIHDGIGHYVKLNQRFTAQSFGLTPKATDLGPPVDKTEIEEEYSFTGPWAVHNRALINSKGKPVYISATEGAAQRLANVLNGLSQDQADALVFGMVFEGEPIEGITTDTKLRKSPVQQWYEETFLKGDTDPDAQWGNLPEEERQQITNEYEGMVAAEAEEAPFQDSKQLAEGR